MTFMENQKEREMWILEKTQLRRHTGLSIWEVSL